MTSDLHGCKAGLDPFADQQHLAGIAKTGDTAATGPSIILSGSTGAFPEPSRARKVRRTASGVPSTPCVTKATIAGQ